MSQKEIFNKYRQKWLVRLVFGHQHSLEFSKALQVCTMRANRASSSLMAKSLVVVWLVAVIFGIQFLWSYENRAGATVGDVSHAPSFHHISLDSERPTLVVFAHPHCPCSRASLAQLERVLSAFPDKFRAQVHFYWPSTRDEEWAKSLWEKVQLLPSTQAVWDRDGREAKLFQAKISGEIFVISPRGDVLFHGGLTPSRGHEGDSVGLKSLTEIARHGHSEIQEAPVFGCTLYQDSKQTLGGS